MLALLSNLLIVWSLMAVGGLALFAILLVNDSAAEFFSEVGPLGQRTMAVLLLAALAPTFLLKRPFVSEMEKEGDGAILVGLWQVLKTGRAE